MNTIRWTFTDRVTGSRITVPGPVNKQEREQLGVVIRNVREGGALA